MNLKRSPCDGVGSVMAYALALATVKVPPES
jgi:hypothetical protein